MGGVRRHGHARTDPENPQPFAVCDRCGGLYNHIDLTWQKEWNGKTIYNKRYLHCERCLDVPNELNRNLTLPADPPPILNPRPEFYSLNETDYFVTEDGQPLVNEDGITRQAPEGQNSDGS
jgi:hypothetical protein